MTQPAGSRAGAMLTPVQQALSAETVAFVDRFVSAIGWRYTRIFSLEDLAQIGQLAQVEAALDFDASRGDFPTLVKWRVRFAILNAVKKELPHAKALLCAAYVAVCFGLADAADPWDSRAFMSGTAADDRANAQAFIDGLLAGAFAGVVGEVLHGEGEEGHAQRQLYRRAVEAMREDSARLPELQQEILDLHYGQEVELKVIATMKNLHYSTIRDHHAKALAALAKRLAQRGVRRAGDAGLTT
ncbi:MAG TPA: sigma factor-like helix-turn-helix DNA-binding protein [Polyangiaceae bacterium]|nr:sigma factor-like helix-turn-helix DNA-binding protein [Polyangiaceae bacterium]